MLYRCSVSSIWIKAMKALYQRVVYRIAGNHLLGQYLNIAPRSAEGNIRYIALQFLPRSGIA